MNASEFEARLKDLLVRLQGQFAAPENNETCDPVEEILLGILGRDTTEARARQALEKLRAAMVDANELRVAAPADIIEEIGPDFPGIEAKAQDISNALSTIFEQTEGLDLTEFRAKPKREAGKWLAEVPGIDPYTLGRVMLRCFGAHAVPVSEPILACLQAEGLFGESVGPAEAQGVLERHVRSSDAMRVFHLLHRWAEQAKPRAPRTPPPRRKPVRRSATRKASDKPLRKGRAHHAPTTKDRRPARAKSKTRTRTKR